MTQKQINAILTEIGGFTENSKINLKPVSEIILTTNQNVYINDRTDVIFDSVNELLCVYFENGNTIEKFISYKDIVGFMMTSPSSIKEPYRHGTTI